MKSAHEESDAGHSLATASGWR